MPRRLRGELSEALLTAPAAVVVTPEERLARAIRRQWDQTQREAGRTHWEPARVLSWPSWLRSQWERLLAEGRVGAPVLERVQERLVWQRLIAEEMGEASLGRRSHDLARRAAQSYGRLADWNGLARWRSVRSTRTEEEGGTAFARWCDEVERWAERERWTMEASLPERLQRLLARDGAAQPALVLVGFGEQTPAQQRLFLALEEGGWRMLRIASPAEEPEEEAAARTPPLLAGAADSTEELRRAARWARGRIERARAAGTEVRLALVVPDLAGERDEIEATLREVLEPGRRGLEGASGRAVFEVGLGRSLAAEPMVRTALELLRWVEEPLSLARLRPLLLSPYFAGGDGEQAQRARLLAGLPRQRTWLTPEVSLEAAVQLLSGSGERAGMPRLLAALRAMERVRREVMGGGARREARGTASAAGVAEAGESGGRVLGTPGWWAEKIEGWLGESGWREHGALHGATSREFQVRRRWEGVLDVLASLGFEGRPMGFAEVLGLLQQLAEETLFAVETSAAPLEVISPRELSPGMYDGVWVLRAHETGWPEVERATASALLPWALQAEMGMPGTDDARDRAALRAAVLRAAGAADEVIFSFARSSEAGVAQGPAALVDLVAERAPAGWMEMEGEEVHAPVAVERIEDEARIAGPLPEPVPGGAAVLEWQAACGFRAFAQTRLGAREATEPEGGLSAAERGTVLHRALDQFWCEVGDQARLRAMDAGTQDEVVARCVGEALAELPPVTAGRWETAYLDLQRTRFAELLRRWLREEARRPDFAVEKREHTVRATVAGVVLDLRMDRVDVDAATGARIVLDYKSGPASPADWEGDRPKRPQLPLYVAALAEAAAREAEGDARAGRVGAAAFALVQPGKPMGLKGVGVAGLLPGTGRHALDAETAKERFAAWSAVVEELAADVLSGDARVRPKQFPSTCERCAQRLLCRVDAGVLEGMLEEEEAEPGVDASEEWDG